MAGVRSVPRIRIAFVVAAVVAQDAGSPETWFMRVEEVELAFDEPRGLATVRQYCLISSRSLSVRSSPSTVTCLPERALTLRKSTWMGCLNSRPRSSSTDVDVRLDPGIPRGWVVGAVVLVGQQHVHAGNQRGAEDEHQGEGQVGPAWPGVAWRRGGGPTSPGLAGLGVVVPVRRASFPGEHRSFREGRPEGRAGDGDGCGRRDRRP